MKEVFELTEQGKIDLENELEYIKSVERPRNIEAIKEARAQGDLSENADYDAARDEQRRIEARIYEIENILKNARIIKKTESTGVSIGKTVVLEYLRNNREVTFEIVGTVEADPFKGRISNESPLGHALIGHNLGDVVEFTTDSGLTQQVRIKEIR